MIQAIRKLVADRRGASAIEFALLIAPFLLMLFGVIEFSRAWWTKQAIQDVASATARCLGVGQTECLANEAPSIAAAVTFAQRQASGRGVLLRQSDVQVTRGANCQDMTGAIAVTLSTQFDSVFPFDEMLDFSARACFLDWSAL